ncbi:MAG: tetratricopeptide repeat protein [Deltaproteobacteria bacterium]|nr:tetratricopeptide repeat protein [Deltaproteobacteria bacterium]MBW2122388.1 tetratricopeptide repeat protein [Deltaproteobacteria bacterium]
MERLFSTRDIERLTGLKQGRIRYWKKIGLIRPSGRAGNGRDCYTFMDLVCFRTAKELLDEGISLKRVTSGLKNLERILPSVKRPLAHLRIRPDGKGGLVVSQRGVTFEPDGQMLLDFCHQDQRGGPQIKPFPRGLGPRHWFERGCSLDSSAGTLDRAIEAYRKALEIRPDFPDALTNLGNIYYHQGESQKAKECYQKAILLDPGHVAANFNLGNLLEEEGSLLPAVSYYEKALSADPLFADAHFNLALVYEKLQLKMRARPHWKRFVELRPDTEEAALARKFLDN